ncbi:MAG TPA: FxsA family protein [Pseudomonadales bacterium]
MRGAPHSDITHNEVILFRLLFLLFLTVPIVEMGVLIWVGGYIGILPTLALVVLTAVLGVALLRLQGFLTLQRIQQKLALGDAPDVELIEGGLLLIGGALLLTPGFVTDAVGFTFLLPSSRRWLARSIIKNSILQFFSRGGRGSSESSFYAERVDFYRPQEKKRSGYDDSSTIDVDFKVDSESRPDDKTTLH